MNCQRGQEKLIFQKYVIPLASEAISGLVFCHFGPETVRQAQKSRIFMCHNVIWGARQDPGFGDTIKVMAIITGVGGVDLRDAKMEPNKLGDALKLTRSKSNSGGEVGFQRFD